MSTPPAANPPTPKAAARRRAAIDKLLDTDLFKALADPTRVRLLACLIKCGRRCSVSEVAECCSVDFSVVARHLALLARAGALDAVKEGRTVWYSPRCAHLTGHFRALADSIDEWCCTESEQCCDAGGGPCGCA
ncbi:MAG TPA: metalloregulator ArsR/SmtB family transcription factor [Phycisphaerales bacterium]|nr:metalloregulator ArsR/SmtB family transcription factor [Phycisphaerales bacterium]